MSTNPLYPANYSIIGTLRFEPSVLGSRAVQLRSPDIKDAQHRRPTDVRIRFKGSLRLRFRTPCVYERRIAEFIPPQGRHVPEHRSNSNAFENSTLKRHECRAPLGRAVLLRSSNIKAAQQRRPTDVLTWFMARTTGLASRHQRVLIVEPTH